MYFTYKYTYIFSLFCWLKPLQCIWNALSCLRSQYCWRCSHGAIAQSWYYCMEQDEQLCCYSDDWTRARRRIHTSSKSDEHDSVFVTRQGTSVIHHSELFGCQRGRGGWKDTRGKIFLRKLMHSTNNGCYVLYTKISMFLKYELRIKMPPKMWNTVSTLHHMHSILQWKILWCLQCFFQMHELAQWLDGSESPIWSWHLIWLCCRTYQKGLCQCRTCMQKWKPL